MNETHSTLSRLEARIDNQAAQLDALYAMLYARGILPRPMDAGRGGVLFDELDEVEDAPLVREARARVSRRRRGVVLRVGEATGV
jgi:hypothetical protein